MAASKNQGFSTFKGLIMLAVALGVPYVLATRTSLPERINDYLVERRMLHREDYSWGGGDAPGFSGNSQPGSVLDHAPPGVALADHAVVPAAYSAKEPGIGGANSAQQGVPPAIPVSSVDRFSAIERRLRQLGSVYFVLETQGTETPRYRCLCQTAVAGNKRITHKFESTKPNALDAMQDVLNQVERWHGGW